MTARIGAARTEECMETGALATPEAVCFNEARPATNCLLNVL